jgi:hypothetical protein
MAGVAQPGCLRDGVTEVAPSAQRHQRSRQGNLFKLRMADDRSIKSVLNAGGALSLSLNQISGLPNFRSS